MKMDDLIKQLKIAMECDKQGDWDKAHEIVQDLRHEFAYRAHAYLHRKEGDISSANYWYRYAGIQPFKGRLKAEQEFILKLLGEAP